MSVWHALREKHAPPEWAYFEEVRNGTGFSKAVTRTADALAFSLYPSRGLELHGFEVKTARSDWLREKKDPMKAEEIAQFCHRWWLVTTPGVVKDVGEVPPGWGWLELNGNKLQTKQGAPGTTPKPLDLPMVAAILRKASDSQDRALERSVGTALDERMEAEREANADRQKKLSEELEKTRHKAMRYQSLIHQIESALGEEILKPNYAAGGYDPVAQLPEQLVEKLGAFKQADLGRLRQDMLRAADLLKSAASSARWVLRNAGVRVRKIR